MKKEIDVVELIRMHRYFNRVVEKVLSPEERTQLKSEESFKIIDPDFQQPWWSSQLFNTIRGSDYLVYKSKFEKIIIKKSDE